ncbi:hypothetical protein GW916_12645 [bacterium]|nr:hypothetical protein [bacterium]
MRFNILSLTLAALLTLNGCFLSDNTAPSTTIMVTQSDGDAKSCPNFKTLWKEDAADEEITNAILCYIDDYSKKRDNVRMPRPEGLMASEIATIVTKFVSKGPAFRADEIRVALFVKSLLVGGSQEFLKWEEVDQLREIVAKNASHWLKIRRDPEIRDRDLALIKSVLENISPSKELGLTVPVLIGASQIVERFSDAISLEEVREETPRIFSGLASFLGYSSETQKISLFEAVNRARRSIDAFERLEDLSQTKDPLKIASSSSDLNTYQNLRNRIRSQTRQLAIDLIAATGYGSGGRVSVDGFREFFESLNRIRFTQDGEIKKVTLLDGPEILAKAAFNFVGKLAGNSKSSSLGRKDFETAGETVLFEVYESNLARDVEHFELSKSPKIFESLRLSESQTKLYQSILPIATYESSEKLTLNWGALVERGSGLRIVHALISGFDKNGNGTLELSQDLKDKEFTTLLRLGDYLKGALSSSHKDDKDKEKEGSLKEVLSSPKASMVFGIWADNMAQMSKGDASLNAHELSELFEQLEDISWKQSHLEQYQDAAFPEWILLDAELLSNRFQWNLHSSLINQSWNNEKARYCLIEAIKVSASEEEFLRKHTEYCTPKGSQDVESLKEIFKKNHDWVVKASLSAQYKTENFSSQLALSHLLTQWLETVMKFNRKEACENYSSRDTNCPSPITEKDFAKFAKENMGPSSLRIIPPKFRAAILATNLDPAEALAKLLFNAYDLLEIKEKNGLNKNELLAELLKRSANNNKKLAYRDLLLNSWALARLLSEN